MDRSFIQQMFVFAAIFLLLQVVFDVMQSRSVTASGFFGQLITTVLATVCYGALTLWLKKRKEGKE